jgi:hypothetical protein
MSAVAISRSPYRVHIEYLQARGLQALLYNPREALQNFVTQVMILLAFLAQTLAIERDGAHAFCGASLVLPLVRR